MMESITTTASNATPPTSAISASVGWIEDLLLGSIGTSIAVIAVALLGIQLLFGRTSPKAGLRIFLGCFILFGAPKIAAGIVSAARTGPAVINRAPALGTAPPSGKPRAFDPYAGAATPVR